MIVQLSYFCCNMTSTFFKSPRDIYSSTIMVGASVTTPKSLITFSWSNWHIMAASWRNRTLSLGVELVFKVFIATSICLVKDGFHIPRLTTPNSPAPNCSKILSMYRVYYKWRTVWEAHCNQFSHYGKHRQFLVLLVKRNKHKGQK